MKFWDAIERIRGAFNEGPQEVSEKLEPKMSGGESAANFYERVGRGVTGTTGYDLFDDRGRPTRSTAILLSAVQRCVVLISSVAAKLMCGGGLHIVDEEGNWVRGRRTERILRLFTYSPDGGRTSGYNFIRDGVADFCLDGNLLMWAMRGPRMGRVMMLTRYQPQSAYIIPGKYYGEDDKYQMVEADTKGPATYPAVIKPAMEVIHAMWPKLYGDSYLASTRSGFGTSPIAILSDTLGIGLYANRWIKDRLATGPFTNVHVDHETDKLPSAMKLDGPDLKDEINQRIVSETEGGGPLSTFGAKVSRLFQDDHPTSIVDLIIQEVARAYGIPLPLMSLPLTQLGATVTEQISKLGWRWGLGLHVDAILSAFSLRLLMPGESFEPDVLEFVKGDVTSTKELITAVMGSLQSPPLMATQEIRHKLLNLPKEVGAEYEDDRAEWLEIVKKSMMKQAGGGGGAEEE